MKLGTWNGWQAKLRGIRTLLGQSAANHSLRSTTYPLGLALLPCQVTQVLFPCGLLGIPNLSKQIPQAAPEGSWLHGSSSSQVLLQPEEHVFSKLQLPPGSIHLMLQQSSHLRSHHSSNQYSIKTRV
jgi:hypothetical protein